MLVDGGDWPAALAASVLAGSPLHAPLLYGTGGSLPQASAEALGDASQAEWRALGAPGNPHRRGRRPVRIPREVHHRQGPRRTGSGDRAGCERPARSHAEQADRHCPRRGARHDDARGRAVRTDGRADPVRRAIDNPAEHCGRASKARKGVDLLVVGPSVVSERWRGIWRVWLDHPAILRHHAPRVPRPRTRLPWPASPTAPSAGGLSNRGMGSCSQTPRGHSTGQQRRHCRRSATTARCYCLKVLATCPPR